MSTTEMQAGRFPARDYAANRYQEPRRIHAWSVEDAPGWPEGYRILRPACGKVVPMVRHSGYGLAPVTPVTCPGCRAAVSLTGAEQ
jgi:hypothetical protein